MGLYLGRQIGENDSHVLNDSEDIIKLESRSKSSGRREAFCAPTRLTTLCLHINIANRTPESATFCNIAPAACLVA
uniref:Protein SAND n=1 Tax=Rhizophora mucronata TaxID=61149 RepID=A0A2P2MH05_RHIMU